MKLVMLVYLIVIFSINSNIKADSYFSRMDGDWENPATWSNESHDGAMSPDYPGDGDDVYVIHDIVTNDSLSLSFLEIDSLGSLTFNKSVKINLFNIKSCSSVKLEMGSILSINNWLELGESNQGNIIALHGMGSYVEIGQSANLVNNGKSYIDGELRKHIPDNDFPEIMFEVGSNGKYTPLAFDLDGQAGVGGWIGVSVIDVIHPYAGFLKDINFSYPIGRIMKKYWRVTLPKTSNFDRGDRTMAIRCRYLNPQDIPGGALKKCFDLLYWKGGDSSNWQSLTPPTSQFNDNSTSSCGDRDINHGEAKYRPYGTDTSTTAYDISGDIKLGNKEAYFPDNDSYLLGDFVAAQQLWEYIDVEDNVNLTENSLMIYPNPLIQPNELKINLGLKDNSLLTISLINNLGMVCDEIINSSYDSGSHIISFYPEKILASGMYRILVKINGKSEITLPLVVI